MGASGSSLEGDAKPPQGAVRSGLDLGTFLNPGPEFRGVALWMLNDKMELEEASRQLRGFCEAGWGAVITRTYLGTRLKYLSDEWLRLVDRIVEVSREQGTRVFLQEADTKVGGYVTTALLGMEDRFRQRRLVMAPADAIAPPKSTLLKTAAGYKFYDQMIVPPGESSQFFAVMDLLDEDTVSEFVRRCHDAQLAHHGAEFGRTVEAIWMDEPILRFGSYTRLPVLPWTARLPELFAREWGYSLLDHLPSLFHEFGDYRKIRHQFWRTVNAQFKRSYWEPIGRWCAAHQVKFAGHLYGEDTLNDQIGWSGWAMPAYEDMQLPGIDYLTKDISTWRPVGSRFIITPKQCSSVANQLGKPGVLAEMYGVSDQGLTFEDRKWIAEWLAVLGINYRCYHAAFYSLRGGRKRMYPPHIGYQQPYWPHNRLIADPMARLCYVLRQGKYAADVLVLHPVESAHCLFDPAREHPALAGMTRELISLSEHLLALHRGFDYGDEYLLGKYAKVEGSALRVGQMAYRAVVLPSLITIRASTLELLEAFLDAGGIVLSVGELPARVDGAADARVEALNRRVKRLEHSESALREQLEARVPPELALTGRGTRQVWIHERRLASQRIIFLVNTSRWQSAEGELRLLGKGRFESWNLADGSRASVAQWADGPHACTALSFAPTQSHLLVFHEGEQTTEQRSGLVQVTETVALGPEFAVRRRDPNALTLDFCRYRLGDGEWSAAMPVIGVLEKLIRVKYAGPVTLQYRFAADIVPSACSLVLEDSEQCQVTVNGTPVPRTGEQYFWDKGFHRIEITGLVMAGENTVEVFREFRPPDPDAVRDHERFYGTDLEAVYVIGDFAVKAGNGFRLVPEVGRAGGDLVEAGYPFYAGTVTLSQEVTLRRPTAGERVALELHAMHAALALLRVSGEDAGAILCPPYRAEITHLVREASNRIEINLVGTLRNLLGPHHYRGPLRSEVWQTHFTAMMEDSDWMEPERRQNLQTWSDCYEFAPFGIEGARIIYEKVGA